MKAIRNKRSVLVVLATVFAVALAPARAWVFGLISDP
jgi:hypothetical protein